MLIAIDYDKTITADPHCFMQIIKTFQKWGHNIIIVTGRSIEHRIEDKKLWGLQIFYSNGEYKKHYIERMRVKVDIWIDDQPGTVEPGRILSGH